VEAGGRRPKAGDSCGKKQGFAACREFFEGSLSYHLQWAYELMLQDGIPCYVFATCSLPTPTLLPSLLSPSFVSGI
jgi:hypothetical protein